MSATRLLVLGVVRMHGRAHGYLVRSELLSWGADEWAHIKFGSIYHALRQLAKDGLLKSTDIPDWPGRVDYEIAPPGDEEFFRLLRDALRQGNNRPDMLGAALVLLPALSRKEAIGLLRERIASLSAEQSELIAKVDETAGERPQRAHIRELLGLWEHGAASQAAWTEALIERLEAGAYVMAGEEKDA
ncbi:PadR family transcriptional regulator [Streptomyces violaceus]|uniref:Helix-turn-helix transcriptional regulator n=1 Tax=Streptomyces violaceus TaxID=1936 RepID=A0ABY9U8H0_STRVL|nr:helix-turn-helix transcriptional regulator [Streptomyces janthinus]WND19179.1 helix-turn-helix transcriptional regulator [Streptomyces janthinus]GGS93883.1 transcriptional regulator [Streptomyces janthinus]